MKDLCDTCKFCKREPIYVYWRNAPYQTGYQWGKVCYVDKLPRGVKLLKTQCPKYINQYVPSIEKFGGETVMVKLTEIQTEEERVELGKLPVTNILLAVSEEQVAATKEKTGGLKIVYAQKDGKQFPQKYSKVSGKRLVEALTKLRYESTEPLFKNWHEYALEAMRVGYPRYIPIKKA